MSNQPTAMLTKTVRRLFSFCALLLTMSWLTLGQNIAPVITVDHGANAPEQQKKPYVILVSLDGFRNDYPQLHGAPNLQALAARGASAPQGMIPSYPSVTFPNHYTIVTGLYPEHHGIVENVFYDPVRKQRYTFNDLTSSDGSWYSGTPLWSLAEQQGMRSACFFWPGSEAEIAGQRPTYYLHFKGDFPGEKRVEQVIAWLNLPPEIRPHFITLYYGEVDHAGHLFGPESPQVAEAVHYVDGMIGRLVAALKTVPLPVDLIVVADHGMAKVEGDWVDLSHYADLSDFETAGSLLYPKNDEAAAKAYQKLHGASDAFSVFRRSQMPPELHFDSNPRGGDPVIVVNGPYALRIHAPPNGLERKPEAGSHGYDPRRVPAMRALFYAAGPDIRPGVTVASFENVNIYPLIARILGLQIGKIDGDIEVLQSILQARGPQPTSQPK